MATKHKNKEATALVKKAVKVANGKIKDAKRTLSKQKKKSASGEWSNLLDLMREEAGNIKDQKDKKAVLAFLKKI